MKDYIPMLEAHILNRDFLPISRISLSGILKKSGMLDYYKLCHKRIEDAGLVDGCNVKYVDRSHKDIILNSEGVAKCHDIIVGYIPEDELDYCTTQLDNINAFAESMNNILYSIRSLSSRELKELKKHAADSNVENDVMIIKCIQTELESRKLKNIIRLIFKGI